MKTWMSVFSILLLFFVKGFAGDAIQVDLFGTASAPKDTISISAGDTVVTRTFFFKNPHKIKGSSYIYGYAAKKTGTAGSIFVDVRMLNDSYDNNNDDWQTNVATLTPGDSASYRISLSLKSWWDYCDGVEVRYRAEAGTFTYRLQAKGKVR